MLSLNTSSEHGGVLVERLARLSSNPNEIEFTTPMQKQFVSPNFSFSGLKASVSRFISNRNLSVIERANIANAFQTAAFTSIYNSTRRAFVFSGLLPTTFNKFKHPDRLGRQVNKDLEKIDLVIE